MAPAEPPRARDELFEAVVEVSGWKLEALTKSARGRANTAVKELREVGAGPDDVRAAAKVYARKWPDMELTPTALAANWTSLGSTNGNGQVRAGPSCQWCDVALARHDDEGCIEIRKINGWN